jgi:hypothetical protein
MRSIATASPDCEALAPSDIDDRVLPLPAAGCRKEKAPRDGRGQSHIATIRSLCKLGGYLPQLQPRAAGAH